MKLTKLAGKPKTEQQLGFMRSNQLEQNDIKDDMIAEEDQDYGDEEDEYADEDYLDLRDDIQD